jgi:hypothetical protein
MRSLFSNVRYLWGKLTSHLLSKTTLARRALLRTEESERKANEAERLDRLRNPSNYRGR